MHGLHMQTATSIVYHRLAHPADAGLVALLMSLLIAGCVRPTAQLRESPLFDRSAPLAPADDTPTPGAIELKGAGGEWLDFTITCAGSATRLRLAPLRLEGAGQATAAQWQAYRVEELPADLNRAAIHRFYGGESAGEMKSFPAALVPLPPASDGAFKVNPAIGKPVMLWVDIQVPRSLGRGEWRTQVEALGPDGDVLARLPIALVSHGFDLPKSRSLTISGTAAWEKLQEGFGVDRAINPELLSRHPRAPENVSAVRRLDMLQILAQTHRLQVEFPDLAAPVKWPGGRDPRIDWAGYDEVIAPWMSGSAFEDGVGVADWPVPTMRGIERYNALSRQDYWKLALAHFDDRGWLEQSTLWFVGEAIDAAVDGVPEALRRDVGYSPAERAQVAAEAARAASVYPAGRIALPLEGDHVRFEGPENPGFIEPEAAGRLMVRAEGLLADERNRPWPAGLASPGRWLHTGDASGLRLPSPGASEADIRLWAWLAFLRDAGHLRTGSALPRTQGPDQVMDPTQIVWFYPADWFGGAAGAPPVPSVQLKWLRRAQQDYEYLAAAAQGLEGSYARVVARALVRPVKVPVGEGVDPLQALWAGTPRVERWDEGLALVADKVAMADPGLRSRLEPRFFTDHTYRTTQWLVERERPLPAITGARWDVSGQGQEQRLHLRLRTETYNPSDATPEGMTLSWVTLPGGQAPPRDERPGLWQTPAIEQAAGVIETYAVGAATLTTSAAVEDIAAVGFLRASTPASVAVRDAFTGAVSLTEATLPAVAVTERDAAPTIDGRLGEWSGNEAFLDGPLVRMSDRPSIQAGRISRTRQTGQAFVGWTAQGLHVAFRFDGVERDGSMRSSRNFVELQDRRTWGEDACEILIQPVWGIAGDPIDGPLLHIVAKPQNAFVRRSSDRRIEAEVWQAFESDLRYAATVDEEGVWRAELTLPWSALRREGLTVETFDQRPMLLRFNLSHHDAATGQSGSWAGPVDHSRDPELTGAIVIGERD